MLALNRARKLIVRHLEGPLVALAKAYRIALGALGGDLCRIGVTGSCGKTMTTEIIGAILGGCSRGRKGNSHNGLIFVAQTIFTIFPWHRFCVRELSGSAPGTMTRSVDMFRPQIGVVTHIDRDHYTRFRSKAATAEEKGKLVESLPVDGRAVLNGDDPHVLAMRDRTRAQIITYGLAGETMVGGEEVSSAWPDRLSLTVVYGSDKIPIRTRLLGEHWAYSVLAAVATGIAMGVPLAECARAVERVEPVNGRMSPHQTPDGITFVRDDAKAPLWTIPASLRFMQTARAQRRVVIIGTISDYPGDSSQKYRAVARQALEAAEKVIFVGHNAHYTLKARSHPADDRIMAFDTVYELSLFLRDYLRRGDLVLLKGSCRADHLQRLVLARTDDIACWRERCGRAMFCSDCRLRQAPYVPSCL